MVRVPLEELVLQIHLLGLGPAGQFLERVLEPPPKASVEGALAQLQALGALTAQQQLTPLGRLHLHYKEACICLKLCGRDVKGVTQRICQDLYCEAQRLLGFAGYQQRHPFHHQLADLLGFAGYQQQHPFHHQFANLYMLCCTSRLTTIPQVCTILIRSIPWAVVAMQHSVCCLT